MLVSWQFFELHAKIGYKHNMHIMSLYANVDNFQLKLSQYTRQKDFDFLITQVDSKEWRNQNNFKTQASGPEFQIQNLSDTPQGKCHA